MGQIVVNVRDLYGKQGFDVPTGEPYRVVVNGYEARIIEMEDANFSFDSAVFLPDPRCEEDAPLADPEKSDQPSDEQKRVTGLAVLRACYLHAKENPADKIVIAGHTDASSKDPTPAYNLQLSQLRAKNVLHVLLGERDAWVAASLSKHRLEDVQQILRWASVAVGWDCHPGEIDDRAGPQTTRAIRGFQKRYNAEFSKSIAVDGVAGKETWGGFFDLYMKELAELMEAKVEDLPPFRSALKFVDDGQKAIGCGAFHPLDKVSSAAAAAPRKAGASPVSPALTETSQNAADRRVEILFFKPADLPKLPCHAGNACKPTACEIYGGDYSLVHVPREGLLAPRLTSIHALTLFEKTATLIEQGEFVCWATMIFGSDVPVEAYRTLQADLREKRVRPPHIRLVAGGELSGQLGVYDKEKREIRVDRALARSAETSQSDAAELFLVLLHEFGHHIDNLLRRDYTNPPIEGDADGEEGAEFAFAVAGMDHLEFDRVEFAVHTRDGVRVPLKLVYTEFHQAVKAYVEDPALQEAARKNNLEGFSAGRGRPDDVFFAHQSIEDALREADPVFFDAIVREKIYFGNWLRDYSQTCSPFILTALQLAIDSQGHGTRVKARDVVTVWLHRKAKEEFKNIQPTPVTKQNLGVYRPEEHIDHPLGIKNEKKIDPDFRGTVRAVEIAVNPATGLLNFIATEGRGWDTSAAYVRASLHDAAGHGPTTEGFRLLGQALHTMEDLYAHSNFVELMLIRLGHTHVFPWVGAKSEILVRGKKRFPMVTGVFGMVDTAVSVTATVAESLEPPIECEGKEFSKGAFEAITLAIGNFLVGGVYETYGVPSPVPPVEYIHISKEELNLDLEQYKKFICESGESAKTWVKDKIAAILTFFLSKLADMEEQFLKDVPTKDRTDPTHSMLSKDHPDHPLHPIAAACAKAVVAQVGLAMRDVWAGRQRDVDAPARVALRYFVHPEDIELQSGDPVADLALRIDAFAKANPVIVRKLDLAGSTATFRREQAERQQHAELSDRLFGGDEETLRRMAQLMPNLDPLGRSTAS